MWHLCFIEHFDHSVFSEWHDWFGREKDVGLEEIVLVLPSLFFLEMLGVVRISGTMPVNQADDKACAKGSFPERQRASALRTVWSLPTACAPTTLLGCTRAVGLALIGLDCDWKVMILKTGLGCCHAGLKVDCKAVPACSCFLGLLLSRWKVGKFWDLGCLIRQFLIRTSFPGT